jgi:putative hydrolase of the HAD superfamily
MRLLDGIDAIVLDAGGVLLLPDPDAIRRELAAAGIDVAPDDETCRRAHYVSMNALDRLGELDWAAVDRALCTELGVPAPQIGHAYAGMERVYTTLGWVPISGAAEALETIERAGMPIAIVSNATGNMEQQLADHQICSVDGTMCARVEIVIDSHVVGVEKPDPRIFGFALAELGIAPERCLYAGDTVHFDVNGARAAGLHPVHVDPFGLCSDLDDHPHITGVADLV